MGKIRARLNILRQHPPATILKEAVWRLRRRLRAWRFHSDPASVPAALRFRPIPYYQPSKAWLRDGPHSVLLRAADRVRKGEYLILGYPVVPLGFPPRWDLDHISGLAWPMQPSDALTVVRFDGSDVKVPWELSRLQCLPVLGKAWQVTGDHAYRQAAMTLVEDWLRNNPVGQGVNWTLAMEASLRAVSLCQLLDLFAPFSNEEQPWLDQVTRSLWQHHRFIAAHDEFSHFLTSNHYLSNLLGQLFLASHLEAPGMDALSERAWSGLKREMETQNHPDGGNREASTGYHAFIFQMFASACHLMHRRGAGIPASFHDRLAKMHMYLGSLGGEEGRLPHVGDCDDGRVEWLADDLRHFVSGVGPRDSLCMQDLIGLGARMLGRPSRFDSPTAGWYGLPETSAAPPLGDALFPDSGFATVRRGKAQAWFFAAPNGIGGKGSHTHNDKLSLCLRLAGIDLLVDSGTGAYTRDPAQRNRYRSTAAHNTVVVDGLEQNSIPHDEHQLFRLENEAAVSPIEARFEAELASLSARHEGYRRFGVEHTRRLLLSANELQIEDRFAGEGTHDLLWRFHIAPGWTTDLSPSTDGPCVMLRQDAMQCSIRFPASSATNPEVEPDEISTAMGAFATGSRISLRLRVPLPFTMVTVIEWTQEK